MSKPKWVDTNTINKSSTSFFFSFSFLLEFHILLDFAIHIVGSIIIGYWSARIIQFILTDLFSNTLTSVILCISMVYLTFYIGKAEPKTKGAVLSVNSVHLCFPLILNPVAFSQPLPPCCGPSVHLVILSSCHLQLFPGLSYYPLNFNSMSLPSTFSV